MLKKIIILGFGGNCIDILDSIQEINRQNPTYDCIGFLHDNEKNWGKEYFQTKVLGPLSMAQEYIESCYFVNGIGSVSNFTTKEELTAKTGIPLDRFETIVHPTASVSRMSSIGKGTVIFQNATVTSNVRIGNHVLVLPNSIVSHDCMINDYVCITGGVSISGNVNVGKSSYLGTHCTIKGGVTLGDYSLVGMGSVVLSDVPKHHCVVGNPAKFLKHTK